MKCIAVLFLFACVACSGSGGAPSAEPGFAGEFAPSRVLVQLQDPDDLDDDEREDFRDAFGGVAFERIGATSFFVLTVGDGEDVADLVARLDDDLRVVDAAPDFRGEAPEGGPANGAIVGTDLLASIAGQPGIAALDLPLAHAVTRGAGQLVAVVDTGVDFDHPLLAGRVSFDGFDFLDNDMDPREERKFRDDDGDGLVDEQFGHGTFVASLVLTIAPEAVILPVRVLDAEGYGTASTVAAGIVYAVDRGATVVNVSVDIPFDPDAVQEAIDYARDREVVVVAAAGNGAAPDVIFPARYSEVVAVGAVDAAGVAAPFTNHGSPVEVVAPGVEMIGAYPVTESPQGTARWSGTSFAAPLVAGTVALVRAAFPGLDEDDAARRVRDTAVSLDAVNPALAGRLGAGLIRPARAVAQ